MDAAAHRMYVPPQQRSGGGSTFIVVLLLCVISVMAGAFFFVMKQNSSSKAVQEATMKLREEQLKRAEARVEGEMKKAKETIGEAKKLKEEATKEKAYADLKEKEAQEAMKKAQETNDANAKKLAEEKKRLAEEAQKKVDEANKKAAEAIAAAKKEAQAAVELKKRLEAVTAKVQGKEELSETATVEKPKERDFINVKIYSHGQGNWYGTRACQYDAHCRKNWGAPTFRVVKFNGKKPQHYLLANDKGRFCSHIQKRKKYGQTYKEYRVRCGSKLSSDEEAYKKNLVFTLKRTEPDGPGNKHDLHLFAIRDDKQVGCGLAGPQGRWGCLGAKAKYHFKRV